MSSAPEIVGRPLIRQTNGIEDAMATRLRRLRIAEHDRPPNRCFFGSVEIDTLVADGA